MNRRRRFSHVSFLGPVDPVMSLLTEEIVGHAFWFLQPGQPPIKMQFKSKNAAHKARHELGASEHAHIVGDQKLFEAIQQALGDAYALGLKNVSKAHDNDDQPPPGDQPPDTDPEPENPPPEPYVPPPYFLDE